MSRLRDSKKGIRMTERLDYNIDITDTEFTKNEVIAYLDGDDDKSKFVIECAELMDISVVELLSRNADCDRHRNQIALIIEFGGDDFFEYYDASDVRETDSHFGLEVYETPNGDFAVGTSDAADDAAKEYIEMTAWAFSASFLSEFTELPEEMFAAVQEQCEGANDAVLKCIEMKEGGIDAFAELAISHDGRGHFLSPYDGEELEQKVNGEWVNMYRVN